MDNSPIQKSCAVAGKVSPLLLALAPHSPYSPNLEPSDFLFFRYLKEKIVGIDFEFPRESIGWI
jgi:hypothetical protein